MTLTGGHDARVVDRSALVVLRELDEAEGSSLVAEVIELFLRDFPLRMAALRSALDESQLAAAAAAVHTIKGSCGAVGAQRMVLACQEVEGLLRRGDGTGASEAIGMLATQYCLVERVLEAELDTCHEGAAR